MFNEFPFHGPNDMPLWQIVKMQASSFLEAKDLERIVN